MIHISFTLQDAPNFWQSFNLDWSILDFEQYTLLNENLIALEVFKQFPNLKKYNRRIKKLRVVDDNDNNLYETTDFDSFQCLTPKHK